MDITDTLAPKSDQLDAVDLAGGPRVFTVDRVSKGSSDQPVQVHLVEFPRVWRPSKGMRRVLAAGWGTDASQWTGRKVRLFCDTEVTFGNERVGGSRVSHLSHIAETLPVPEIIKRGKTSVYTVEPLTADVEVATLRGEWSAADDARREAIRARVAELQGDTLQSEHDAAVDPADLDPEADKQYAIDDEAGA